jgi:8-oxo-dGTP diphosphatase
MDDDFLPGFWDIPGGSIDFGETLEQGLKREILEECGIEIEVVKKITENSYDENGVKVYETTFLARALSTKIVLNHEHTEFRWLKYSNLSKVEISNYVKNLIESAKYDLG